MAETLNFHERLDVLKIELTQFRNLDNNNNQFINDIHKISKYKNWINENQDLISEFNYLSEEVNTKADNLINSIKHILNIISEQALINISYSFNNEKLRIEQNIDILLNQFYKIKDSHSKFMSYFENGLKILPSPNDKTIETNIKDILNEINFHLKETVFTLDELVLSIQIITTTINNFVEQIRTESDKNFKQKFNKESEIIINNFESKVLQITGDYELKSKELKSTHTRVMVENKKILDRLVEAQQKNIELNNKIDNYESILKDIASDANIVTKKHLEKFTSSLTDDFNKEFFNMISEFDKAKKVKSDFVKLVENAGIYKLTENYSKKAEEEKKEYKDYRKYTTWAILAAVFFTVAVFSFAIYENSGNDNSPDYLILISRLSISAMFFILALYLSKQASKHYECYQENHRTFLQLAALEPFMANMSEEEQKEIRKALIPSYFNQGAEGKYSSKGDEIGLPESFSGPLDKILETLKEIKISQNSNKSDRN